MTNLIPVTVQDALAVSQQLAASGMVPRDYANKPGAIYAAIDLGASVGLRPMQALQGIANINGRPSLWGDAALGVVMASPAFESIDEDDAATSLKNGAGRCKIVRKGCPPYEVRFTTDMAKAAGLWGKAGPWSQYPGRMLQMRARSWAFRDRFPDSLKGIRIAEEAMDMPAGEPVAVAEDDMMPRSTATPAQAQVVINTTATAMVTEPAPAAAAATVQQAAPAAATDEPVQAGEAVVTVVAVDTKEGTTNGKAWRKHVVRVKHDDGFEDELGTFHNTPRDAALPLVGKRAAVTVASKTVAGKEVLELVSIRPCNQ